jgi:ribosome maturation factor RimP
MMAQEAEKLETLRERLIALCERSLAAVGYEPVEVEYVREQQGWVLRVYIDHPPSETSNTGGEVGSRITHEDCERASRHLGTVLDVEDPIDMAYRLEVSSPGVRRPLRKERDFARFTGRVARVQLNRALDGRRNFTGRLLSASDGMVDMEVDGAVVRLPLDRVRKAHLEVEL